MHSAAPVMFTLNGKVHTVDAALDPRTTLAEYLRYTVGKRGCDPQLVLAASMASADTPRVALHWRCLFRESRLPGTAFLHAIVPPLVLGRPLPKRSRHTAPPPHDHTHARQV